MSKRTQTDAAPPRERKPDELKFIDIGELHGNTYNPRRVRSQAQDDDLESSIREKGVIEPLIVRPIGEGFEVVAGMRRYDVARRLWPGVLQQLPCVVKDLTELEAREHALVENLQRQDMTPLDEARAYAGLQKLEKRFYTVAKIAAVTGQPEGHVYRRVKLLDLEPELQQALEEDRLSIGHAERLMRLPAALRKEAADPDSGVVWARSPLFAVDDDTPPTKEDLQPLAELERFIRKRAAVDVTSPDTAHFQPDLAQAIDAALVQDAPAADRGAGVVDVAQARREMVLLSEDTFARVSLGADKGDKIPLTPSKWREITKPAQRCEYAEPGVVVHGGPHRVLTVCATKTCRKHFPPAKKKSAPKGAAGKPAAPREDPFEVRERERKAAEQLWARVWPDVKRALVAQFDGAKVTADLVRAVARNYLRDYDLQAVQKDFGIALADKTIGQVLALTFFTQWTERGARANEAKRFRFDLAPFDAKLKSYKDADAKAEKAIHAPHPKAPAKARAKKPAAKKAKVS